MVAAAVETMFSRDDADTAFDAGMVATAAPEPLLMLMLATLF
jgi:hypothetical protein